MQVGVISVDIYTEIITGINLLIMSTGLSTPDRHEQQKEFRDEMKKQHVKKIQQI
jgi:hypothetical protein